MGDEPARTGWSTRYSRTRYNRFIINLLDRLEKPKISSIILGDEPARTGWSTRYSRTRYNRFIGNPLERLEKPKISSIILGDVPARTGESTRYSRNSRTRYNRFIVNPLERLEKPKISSIILGDEPARTGESTRYSRTRYSRTRYNRFIVNPLERLEKPKISSIILGDDPARTGCVVITSELQLGTEGRLVTTGKISNQGNLFTGKAFQGDERKPSLFSEQLTPQEPLWEAPVKKSTTAYRRTALQDIALPRNTHPKAASRRQNVNNTVEILSEKINLKEAGSKSEDAAGTVLDGGGGGGTGSNNVKKYRRTKQRVKEAKRLLRERKSTFGINVEDGSDTRGYNMANEAESEGMWDSLGKSANENAVLKGLLHQDSSLAFGTAQEVKDEQNTINEIERLSRESSILPKDLHFPYMNGPTDNLGLDFSKMDISIGKYKSDFDNNGENSQVSYLRRNFIPVKGHPWETRNRDRIPRHRIAEYHDDFAPLSEPEYDYFPKLRRFPAFAPSPEIQPPNLEAFARFSPMPRAILWPEDKSPREPIPPRETEPEDEPLPISEFIQAKEPAPIPEIPFLREITPISEQRETAPEDLNPKDTFGS
ncbi:hypothetical protein QZH41_008024 [Actinostola sp. cb2023]|nr:hypothetical protein QZH41_008024 [Actinostola sp. cb2023]